MKTGQTLGTIIALAVCVGCRTAYQPTEFAPTPDTRVVKIVTDPPGMRIYFAIGAGEGSATRQREYVGQSPCAATVKSDEDGRFVNEVSTFARPKAIFEAEPPSDATNLFAQRQVFTVPALFIRPPPIPRSVFFDMHKPASAP